MFRPVHNHKPTIHVLTNSPARPHGECAACDAELFAEGLDQIVEASRRMGMSAEGITQGMARGIIQRVFVEFGHFNGASELIELIDSTEELFTGRSRANADWTQADLATFKFAYPAEQAPVVEPVAEQAPPLPDSAAPPPPPPLEEPAAVSPPPGQSPPLDPPPAAVAAAASPSPEVPPASTDAPATHEDPVVATPEPPAASGA